MKWNRFSLILAKKNNPIPECRKWRKKKKKKWEIITENSRARCRIKSFSLAVIRRPETANSHARKARRDGRDCFCLFSFRERTVLYTRATKGQLSIPISRRQKTKQRTRRRGVKLAVFLAYLILFGAQIFEASAASLWMLYDSFIAVRCATHVRTPFSYRPIVYQTTNLRTSGEINVRC